MTPPATLTDQAPLSQSVVQNLTRAAIFLVVTINPGTTSRAAVRSFCGDLPALVRAVGFRDLRLRELGGRKIGAHRVRLDARLPAVLAERAP